VEGDGQDASHCEAEDIGGFARACVRDESAQERLDLSLYRSYLYANNVGVHE
jgi:hypothetical protein